jgi:hypothetical protein
LSGKGAFCAEPRLLNKCIEASTSSGDSALVLAIRAGSLESVRALRAVGAAVTLPAVRVAAEKDDDTTTADAAVGGGAAAGAVAPPLLAELLGGLDDPAVLSSCLLLQSTAADGVGGSSSNESSSSKEQQEETPLAAASRVGNVDSVVYILQRAAEVLPDGPATPGLGFGDALRGAVCFNHLSTLQALLSGACAAQDRTDRVALEQQFEQQSAGSCSSFIPKFMN